MSYKIQLVRPLWLKCVLVCMLFSIYTTGFAQKNAEDYWTSYTSQPSVVNGVYQISSASELAWFANYVGLTSTEINARNTTANAVLTNDIDLNDHYWVPIASCDINSGDDNKKSCSYKGTFDGQGYSVKNLNVQYILDEKVSDGYNTSAGFGLFSVLGSGAVIKNLNIVSGNIINSDYYTGAIAGSIVGEGSVKIINCSNNATVKSGAYVGGLVGGFGFKSTASVVKPNVLFENCYNWGRVTSTGSVIPGSICGNPGEYAIVNFKNCYNKGYVACSDGNYITTCFVEGTKGTVTYSNCYAETNFGTSSIEGLIYATTEEFNSGKITYLLNTSGKYNYTNTDEEINFVQDLSASATSCYPVLGNSSSENRVYRSGYVVDGGKTKADQISEAATHYYNTSSTEYSIATFKTESSEFKNQTLRYSLNTSDGSALYGKGSLCFIIDGVNSSDVSHAMNCDLGIHYEESATMARLSTNRYTLSNELELRWASWYVNNANEYQATGDDNISYPNRAILELSNDIEMNTSLIDADEYSFVPIGNSTTKRFGGSFDGKRHCIKNLQINSSSTLLGLIGFADGSLRTNGLEIYNLGIESGSVVNTSTDDYSYAAGILGGIEKEFTTNSIVTISNCYNKADISAKRIAGGIVGVNAWPCNTVITLKNCYNIGNITATKGNIEASQSTAGGIIGYNSNSGTKSTSSTFTNCYNLGTITIGGSTSSNPNTNGGTFTNFYALKGTNDISACTVVTDEQVKKGELAYMLNGDQSSIIFGQCLASDDATKLDKYPILLSNYVDISYNNTAKNRVYPVEYVVPENLDDAYYAWDNLSLTELLADDSKNNGFSSYPIPTSTYYFNYNNAEQVSVDGSDVVLSAYKGADKDSRAEYPTFDYFDQENIRYGSRLLLTSEDNLNYVATAKTETMQELDAKAIVSNVNDSKYKYFDLYSAMHLRWFSYYVNHVNDIASAVLSSDIDLQNTDFEPIGNGYSVVYHSTTDKTYATSKFRGVFNGRGHKIENINVSVPTTGNEYSFYKYGGDKADVEKGDTDGKPSTGTIYSAGLFGEIQTYKSDDGIYYGVIDSVYVASGSISSPGGARVGGIVGYVRGNSKEARNTYIVNCYNKASISGKDCVGGIVGEVANQVNTIIKNCYNQGSVSANTDKKGGIVYYAGLYKVTDGIDFNGSLIENCYNSNSSVGLISTLHPWSSLTNCTVTDVVPTNSYQLSTDASITTGNKSAISGTYYNACQTDFNNGIVAVWLNGVTDLNLSADIEKAKLQVADIQNIYGQKLSNPNKDTYPEFFTKDNGLYAIYYRRPDDNAFEAWSLTKMLDTTDSNGKVTAQGYISKYNAKYPDNPYPADVVSVTNNFDEDVAVSSYPTISFVEQNSDRTACNVFYGGSPIIEKTNNIILVTPKHTVFGLDENNKVAIADSLQLQIFASMHDKNLLGSNSGGYPAYLTNDIVLDNTIYDDVLEQYTHYFTPIGTYSLPYKSTFDGCGYKITGLTNVRQYDENTGVGLFGNLSTWGASGTVQNLGIEGEYTVPDGVKDAAALVAAGANFTVTNCYTNVNISGGTAEKCAGIIADGNSGTINYCYNLGTINGAASVNGGIVGQSWGTPVNGCYNLTEQKIVYNGNTATNSYDLTSSGKTASGNFVLATEDEFKNGSVAWNLNYLIGSCVYGQNVTIKEFDSHPVFFNGDMSASPVEPGNCVYKASYNVPDGAVQVENWPVAFDETALTYLNIKDNNVDLTEVIGSDNFNFKTVPFFKEKNIYYGNDFELNDVDLTAYNSIIDITPKAIEMSTTNGYYEIADSLQLRWASYYQNLICSSSNGTTFNFKLTNDIDLSVRANGVDYNQVQFVPFGKGLKNIAWYKVDGTYYTGVFDGQNHTIKNLYENSSTLSSSSSYSLNKAGLFAQTQNATIKNTIIEGYLKGAATIGGFVSRPSSGLTIDKCGSNCIIDGGSQGGGIIGGTSAVNIVVSNSFSIGKIISTNKAQFAGIAGNLTGSANSSKPISFTNCYTTSSIYGGRVGNRIACTSSPNVSYTNCYVMEIADSCYSTTDTPDGVNYESAESFTNGKVCYLLNAGGYGKFVSAPLHPIFVQSLSGDAAYNPENEYNVADSHPIFAIDAVDSNYVHKAGIGVPYEGAEYAYSNDKSINPGWYFNGKKSSGYIDETGHYNDCVPTYAIPFFYSNKIYTGNDMTPNVNIDTKDIVYTSSEVKDVLPGDDGYYSIDSKLSLYWLAYFVNGGHEITSDTYTSVVSTYKAKLTADIDMNPGFSFSSHGYKYTTDGKVLSVPFRNDTFLTEYYEKNGVPYYKSEEYEDSLTAYTNALAWQIVDENALERKGVHTPQSFSVIGTPTTNTLKSWYWDCVSTHPFTGVLDGQNHKISNLYITGTATAIGLIGCETGCTVKNLGIESGYIHAGSCFCGGFIAAHTSGTSYVQNCYNKAFCYSGDVNSSAFVGAVVGNGGTVNLENCINYADIYSVCDVGALCSNMHSTGYIKNCINIGRVMSRSGFNVDPTGTTSTTPLNAFYLKSVNNSDSNTDTYYYRSSATNTMTQGIARYTGGTTMSHNYFVDFGDYDNETTPASGVNAEELSAFAQGDVAYSINDGITGYKDQTDNSGLTTENIEYVQNMMPLDMGGDKYPVLINFSSIDNLVYKGKLYTGSADASEDFYLNYTGANHHPHSGVGGESEYTELGTGYDNWIVFFRHDNDKYNPHSESSILQGNTYGTNCVWFDGTKEVKVTTGSKTTTNTSSYTRLEDLYNAYPKFVNRTIATDDWGHYKKDPWGNYEYNYSLSGTTSYADNGHTYTLSKVEKNYDHDWRTYTEYIVSDSYIETTYTTRNDMYGTNADKILLTDPSAHTFKGTFDQVRERQSDYNFYVPVEVNTKSVSYVRTLSDIDQYYTINLPYNLYAVVSGLDEDVTENVKLYKYTSYVPRTTTETGSVTFQKVGMEIDSNGNYYYPAGCYMLKYTDEENSTGSVSLTFKGSDYYEAKEPTVSAIDHTSVSGEGDSYAKGVFQQEVDKFSTDDALNYMSFWEGFFYRMEKGSYINPFRMYLYLPKSTDAAARTRVVFSDITLTQNDDTVTGIVSADDSDVESVDVYTLNGILVKKNVKSSEATDNLESGVYLVGGKKVYKK